MIETTTQRAAAGSRRRVAFIGLGTMGAPMASNLLTDGHQVVVHNRPGASGRLSSFHICR